MAKMTFNTRIASIGAILLPWILVVSAKSSKSCIQFEVPVRVSANNIRCQTSRVDSNIDAVDWVWDTDTWSHTMAQSSSHGVVPILETFTINAQLCILSGGKKSAILQIATHGVGFDKR